MQANDHSLGFVSSLKCICCSSTSPLFFLLHIYIVLILLSTSSSPFFSIISCSIDNFCFFLFDFSFPAGLRTRACSPMRRASLSGLCCWVTSRGRGQRPPTWWDRSVVMETVSPALVARLLKMER